LNSEEIKLAALAITELVWRQVGQSARQSVENLQFKKKIHFKLVEGFMIELKKFLSLSIPNQHCLDVT